MKERQRQEKAKAKERKAALAQKAKVQNKILSNDVVENEENVTVSKKKVVVSADVESDDEGDNDLIRYAALQKRK